MRQKATWVFFHTRTKTTRYRVFLGAQLTHDTTSYGLYWSVPRFEMPRKEVRLIRRYGKCKKQDKKARGRPASNSVKDWGPARTQAWPGQRWSEGMGRMWVCDIQAWTPLAAHAVILYVSRSMQGTVMRGCAWEGMNEGPGQGNSKALVVEFDRRQYS